MKLPSVGVVSSHHHVHVQSAFLVLGKLGKNMLFRIQHCPIWTITAPTPANDPGFWALGVQSVGQVVASCHTSFIYNEVVPPQPWNLEQGERFADVFSQHAIFKGSQAMEKVWQLWVMKQHFRQRCTSNAKPLQEPFAIWRVSERANEVTWREAALWAGVIEHPARGQKL